VDVSSALADFRKLHLRQSIMNLNNDHLISVKIFNIYPYADAQQGLALPQNFLVFLKGEENKVVPITIGHFEGQALLMAMRKIPLPRPLPHNLLQNLLEKMKAKVHKLVIHTLKDEVFHAYLLIQSREETFYLDCRPSDGMILATLLGTPIFMSPEVMSEAGRVLEIEKGEEAGAEEEETLKVADADEEIHIDASAGDDEGTGISRRSASPDDEDMSELEKLKAQLNRLIAEEAYEEAARVRDQIIQLEDD